jgi:hypothetical protein
VTRGTRPKKPSSSRGFAHEARGFWGFQGFRGLKIEIFFPRSKPATTTKSRQQLLFFSVFLFFRVRADTALHPHGQQTASAGEGAGEGGVCADAHCFIPGNFKKDATVCPSTGCPRSHRPSVRKRPHDNPAQHGRRLN